MSRKIFIDCGTHLGMGFSKCASMFNIDHNWEIFGFEANPYVYEGYIKNIQSEKYPILLDKNISLENKAVWISDEGIKFSLRGITKHHIDNYSNDGWSSDLATMVGKYNGIPKKEALKMLPRVSAMLDKLTKTNIIHKNKAANLKSKLTKHVNALS